MSLHDERCPRCMHRAHADGNCGTGSTYGCGECGPLYDVCATCEGDGRVAAQLQPQAPVGDSPGVTEEPRAICMRCWRRMSADDIESRSDVCADCRAPAKENGASDGGREALAHVFPHMHDVEDADSYDYQMADAVLAAGYRKPTLPSVEDMAKEILEAWCWDGDGEQPAPEVRAATAIKAHLLGGE